MKPHEIMLLATKFQESRIFLTAAEMGVFTLLKKNPMSVHEMASGLKATERGVTILLNSVVSLGLLEKKRKVSLHGRSRIRIVRGLEVFNAADGQAGERRLKTMVESDGYCTTWKRENQRNGI